MYLCPFCGDDKKSKKSVDSHKAYCKENPNRSTHDHAAAGRKASRAASKATRLNKSLKIKDEYYNDPNHCTQCNKVLNYSIRKNKFCSKSCSATHNNLKRTFKPGPKPSTIRVKSSEGNHKVSYHISVINQFKIKHCLHRTKCKECQQWFWAEKQRKTCSDQCRRKIYSKTAINNPKMGGNKNTRAYGWYQSPFAGKVWLESSWEYEVASSLDTNGIRWIRPKYIPYGKKKYYPDFFLVDHKVYLDPKNPFLQVQDAEKINKVEKQNNVRVLVLNKDQLSWSKIQMLL